MVVVELVPGGELDITVASKGGGSEAKSKFAMLNPSDSITDWVLKTVPTMGAGWCAHDPICTAPNFALRLAVSSR
jgi:fumarate hydratase class I